MTVVAGAGMAGLVAAARLRELRHDFTLLEKGDRPGGSMLLSSGVIWRHRTFEGFREECPGGIEVLQRLIYDRLDDALDWLERIAAPAVERETGNTLTVGRRFDPRGLTAALARAAGDVELSSPLTAFREGEGVVLATGGFARRLAHPGSFVRAAPFSGDGDGCILAMKQGAGFSMAGDQFYGRAMPAAPARVGEEDFVRASQLYGRYAHVIGDNGEPILEGVEISWSETELAERIGTRTWFVADATALEQRVRERTVADMIAVAEELGGEVRRSERLDGLGLGRLESPKLTRPPFTGVKVTAGITHTIGGLHVDERARVLRCDRTTPVDGLYAAGVDVGLIASGGYSSGLAQALVLGLVAAESIVSG